MFSVFYDYRFLTARFITCTVRVMIVVIYYCSTIIITRVFFIMMVIMTTIIISTMYLRMCIFFLYTYSL